jgi:tRNA(Glu) U13 pseudouridine synthase TruD
MTTPLPEAKAAERAALEAIQAREPYRLQRPKPADPDDLAKRIGIAFLDPNRPAAYFRLHTADTLVEEVLHDGTVIRLDAAEPFRDADDKRALWVDLVKARYPWNKAQVEITAAFGVGPECVGFGGSKETHALSAQRLSIRGGTKEQAEAFAHPQLALRPVGYGNGAMGPSAIFGNRFTVVLRTERHDLDASTMAAGFRLPFWNTFGKQRFGARLNAQRFGQKILQDDLEGALKLFFADVGPLEIPVFADVRRELAPAFGNWEKMRTGFGRFPHTFREEIALLDALIEKPDDFRHALARIPDQVRAWANAYGSYLVNRRLSAMAKGSVRPTREIDPPLPQDGPKPEYLSMMEVDGTTGYAAAFRRWKLPFMDQSIPAKIHAKDVAWKTTPEGGVLRFTLPRGAYETACLGQRFRLYEQLPVPGWVLDTPADPLQTLGHGSLEALRGQFPAAFADEA